ncbi:hypothetical protein BREVNS_1417 [Brevinematales bacterium NS]|nr:hypothetical protein BREVNS_1417 [Brevinematales bacterium NS]
MPLYDELELAEKRPYNMTLNFVYRLSQKLELAEKRPYNMTYIF